MKHTFTFSVTLLLYQYKSNMKNIWHMSMSLKLGLRIFALQAIQTRPTGPVGVILPTVLARSGKKFNAGIVKHKDQTEEQSAHKTFHI